MTDESPKPSDDHQKQFHGWRLLGVVILVLVGAETTSLMVELV